MMLGKDKFSTKSDSAYDDCGAVATEFVNVVVA